MTVEVLLMPYRKGKSQYHVKNTDSTLLLHASGCHATCDKDQVTIDTSNIRYL